MRIDTAPIQKVLNRLTPQEELLLSIDDINPANNQALDEIKKCLDGCSSLSQTKKNEYTRLIDTITDNFGQILDHSSVKKHIALQDEINDYVERIRYDGGDSNDETIEEKERRRQIIDKIRNKVAEIVSFNITIDK